MRYIISVVVALLVVCGAFVLIFTGGSDKKDTPKSTKAAVTKLVDYAQKNSSVSVTTTGKLVGNEERREVRITVTPAERRLEILSTYNESVMSSQTYPNTQTAYSNFLSALNTSGFDKSRKSSITDPRGVCPLGSRYIYDLSEGSNHVSNLWSSSCDSNGTFAGQGSMIRDLFQKQIPDYSKQVQSVKL